MMFLPIFIDRTPATCPRCHKEENIVELCGHCNYAYPQEKDKFLAVMGLLCLAGIVLGVIFITPSFASYGDYSLDALDYISGGMLGGTGMFIAVLLFAGIVWIFSTLFSKKK